MTARATAVGTRTTKGPKPWVQRRASTLYLRVPLVDWPAVKLGYKREFRSGVGKNAVPQIWNVEAPILVVGYAIDQVGRHDARLLVLEEKWREPLGAISTESLALEGHTSLAEFRRYWMARERRRFTPTREVSVFRVRPAEETDVEQEAQRLLDHLYGQFLPAMGART